MLIIHPFLCWNRLARATHCPPQIGDQLCDIFFSFQFFSSPLVQCCAIIINWGTTCLPAAFLCPCTPLVPPGMAVQVGPPVVCVCCYSCSTCSPVYVLAPLLRKITPPFLSAFVHPADLSFVHPIIFPSDTPPNIPHLPTPGPWSTATLFYVMRFMSWVGCEKPLLSMVLVFVHVFVRCVAG